MDSRAFEVLYQAHCGAVRSFVYRRVSPAAADDAVADVFVIAWRRLDEAPDDTLAWLLAITRGVLANRRRGEAAAGGAARANEGEHHRPGRGWPRALGR